MEFPDVPAGLPLGLGRLPFETAEWELPEGSQLVLYTDGLLENHGPDINIGLGLLRNALDQAVDKRPARPEETCVTVLGTMLADRQSDDIALLVARIVGSSPIRLPTGTCPAIRLR